MGDKPWETWAFVLHTRIITQWIHPCNLSTFISLWYDKSMTNLHEVCLATAPPSENHQLTSNKPSCIQRQPRFCFYHEEAVLRTYREVWFEKWVKFNHQSNGNLLCEVFRAGLPRLDSTASLHPLLPIFFVAFFFLSFFCAKRWRSSTTWAAILLLWALRRSQLIHSWNKGLSLFLAFSLHLYPFFAFHCPCFYLSACLFVICCYVFQAVSSQCCRKKGRACISSPRRPSVLGALC